MSESDGEIFGDFLCKPWSFVFLVGILKSRSEFTFDGGFIESMDLCACLLYL